MPLYKTKTPAYRSYKGCISRGSGSIVHDEKTYKDILHIHIPGTEGQFVDSFLASKYDRELVGMVDSKIMIPTPLNDFSIFGSSFDLMQANVLPPAFPARIPLEYQRFADLYTYRTALSFVIHPKLKGLVTVKNPYDRVLASLNSLFPGEMFSSPDSIEQIFDQFVSMDPLHILQQNKPQSFFVKDIFGERVTWLEIVHGDRMALDMIRYGFMDFRLAKGSMKSLGDYRQYFNGSTVDKIRNLFAEDFEWFGYAI